MLSSSDEIAGKGVMFVYVDDLGAERRWLQGLRIARGDNRRWLWELAITLGAVISVDYWLLCWRSGPNGDMIALASSSTHLYTLSGPLCKCDICRIAYSCGIQLSALRDDGDAVP